MTGAPLAPEASPDSPDFSASDAEDAAACAGPPQLVALLAPFLSSPCPVCSPEAVHQGGEQVTHELRRHQGRLYWRCKHRCPAGHETAMSVHADWLQDGG